MKPPASDPKLQPGVRIGGKYRVVRVIAQGGMGSISLCQHEELEQRVAVKTLLPELLDDEDARARFVREARAAAKIQSQNVARVTDVGTDPEIGPYMVMEYLEGSNLDQILALRGRLPVSEVVDWVLEAIDAIAEAHSLGIVHRDLKPSNLFLADRSDGKRVVKVLDFGISKVAPSSGSSHVLTGTTTVVGSPAYMAPEQLKESRSVDPRADVWSLGVVLYELLAGVPPFKGDSLALLFVEVLERDPKDVTTHRADIPPALGAAIMRCLRKDLDQRMPQVADLARDIAPFGTGRAAGTVGRARSLLVDTMRRNGSTAPLGSRSPAPPQQPVTASMPSPAPHARGSQPVVPSLQPQAPSPPPSIPSQPLPSHAPHIGVGARTQSGWQGPPSGPSAASARGRGILVAFLALAMIGVLAASVALYVRHRAKTAAAAIAPTTTLASASPLAPEPPTPSAATTVASATTPTTSTAPSSSSSVVALAPSAKTLGKVPAPGRGTTGKPGTKPTGDTAPTAPATTAATTPASDPNDFLDRRH